MLESIKKIDSFDDLKKSIIEAAGDLDGFDLIGNQVLVGIYIKDKVGSILLSDITKLEDQYQGKVGLILGVGQMAFDREWQKMYGDRVVPKVGDFVTFKIFETWQQKVNSYACRQMDDSVVKARVRNPNMVY